jgi:hypothetical protein
LVELCELSCFDADDYRAAIAPNVTDDIWGDAVALSCDIANGRDPEGPENLVEMAQEIFDHSRLQLLGADAHREMAQGTMGFELSKTEWDIIKYVATEFANGNDPIQEPADWDFTNWRG